MHHPKGHATLMIVGLLAVAVLAWKPVAASAEAGNRATAVFAREQRGTESLHIAGLPPLLPYDELVAAELLLSRRAHLLAGDPFRFPPRVPGTFRFSIGDPPNFAITVVEQDFLECSDAAFVNLMGYFRAYSSLAVANRSDLGVIHRGTAAMAAYSQWYDTDLACSPVALEEVAAYYLIKALNGRRSIGIPPTVPSVRRCLSQFYGGLPQADECLGASVRLLVDPPERVHDDTPRTAVKRDEIALPLRVIAKVLAPRMAVDPSQSDQPPPVAIRTASDRIVSTIISHPEDFSHLPGVYRLLRRCRAVAAGHDPVGVARKEMGLPTVETKDAREIAAELTSLAAIWRSWLDKEAKARKKGRWGIFSKPTVEGDPYAVAELAALLIDHSPTYAKKVRVPVAENADLAVEAILQATREALHEDRDLAGLFDTYGWPEIEIISNVHAPTGMVLQLQWTVKRHRNQVDQVVLQMEDAFSRGGSGLPIEPGLAIDQNLPVCRPNIGSPPESFPLSNLQSGDFLESVADLEPGPKPPSSQRRWHQVAEIKRFGSNAVIRLKIGDTDTLTGTVTQEVWGQLSSRGQADWDWRTLEELLPGDTVCHAKKGPCAVTGVFREHPAGEFLRMTLAGSDHTHVNGFIVKCKNDPIKADPKHGILHDSVILLAEDEGGRKTEAIGKIDANLAARRFVPCVGFSTATAKVTRQKDMLIDVAPEPNDVIYRIAYLLGDQRQTIAAAHSHGFWVERGRKPGLVEAHNIIVGDQLVRDEEGSPLAEVVAVSIEKAPKGQSWDLCHPRLLRTTWVQANGVLVHTAERDVDLPGVLPEVAITLAIHAAEGSSGWHVGPRVSLVDLRPIAPLKSLRPEELPSQTPYRPEDPFHLLLTCWPGGPAALSQSDEFMPQAISGLGNAVTGDIMHIVTDGGKALDCATGTRLWRRTDEIDKGRVRIRTVRARELAAGDQILVLGADSGAPATVFEAIRSADLIDASDKRPEMGYFEIYLPALDKGPNEEVNKARKPYDNIFANGFLVSIQNKEKEEKDLWQASKVSGNDHGATNGIHDGRIVGRPGRATSDMGGTPVISVVSATEQPHGNVFRFDDGDLKQFERSYAVLEKAMADFMTKPPRVPEDPARLARFGRFAQACLPNPALEVSTALSPTSLKASFIQVYCQYRALLLSSGHPDALTAMARVAVPFSYMLYESGGPVVAEALLSDLLTVQMRLALRPRTGFAVWADRKLLVRPTVQFAMELMQMDAVVAPEADGEARPAAMRYWSVSWSAHTWSVLLTHRIEDGEVNADVFSTSDKTDQKVLLWNLLLQMDHRAGGVQMIDGYITRGFQQGTEFEGRVRRDFAPANRPDEVPAPER
jgi:hypothetical protein